MSKFYVTTAIPYVNDVPHLGHAMEFVYADVLARYHRQIGDKPVLFCTGTDEHGSKIVEKAQSSGIGVKEFVQKNTDTFKQLLADLNITNNKFVRTTDENHGRRAQIIWQNLSDYIYKNKYVGMYCVGCEEYVSETVAKENGGVCPIHKRPYERLEEENYFFALSKFNSQILEAIKTGAYKVIPDTKKHEVLRLLEDGLDDISISRPKDKLSWGIAVPGDKTQVMYVWFEALLNYITALDYPDGQEFKVFWPADVQVIGKDILRFHAAIWPGILLGLELPLPKILYVHGFVYIDGVKMSKSLGNVVAPSDIIKKYSADVFRYYFMRHIPSYGDGDFTWERIEIVYNSELANELGNAVGRVAAMVGKYQNNVIGVIPEPVHDMHDYHQAIADCRFDKALDAVWEQVRGLNQYIDVEKPWAIAKLGDDSHLQEVLAYCVGCLLEIAELLVPFMPDTASKIQSLFAEGLVSPLDGPLFPKDEIK
jgi:methionyl-tRNA synthetase